MEGDENFIFKLKIFSPLSVPPPPFHFSFLRIAQFFLCIKINRRKEAEAISLFQNREKE